MAPAPARRQRVAAAPQLALVTGRSPKGVRHATSEDALSNVSAVPLATMDLRDTMERRRLRLAEATLEAALDVYSSATREATVDIGSEVWMSMAEMSMRTWTVVT